MVLTVVPTFAPLWQVAHPVVMPVWLIAGLGTPKPPGEVKLVVEWHVSHVAEVGMWFDGLPITTVAPKVEPLWQEAQPVRLLPLAV